MYAQRSSILALIAAAALGIAATSATASAKDGQTTVHNGSPSSHNTSGPKQSGGSSHMITAHNDHDHDHDHHHDRHDAWHHHDHDRYYNHHYDRYVPTEQVRPYVVRPVIVNSSPPDNCLTKEYLQPDTVLFKDVCTKQWAKNSTNVPTRMASTDAKCLTKENLQGGAVLFKDLCTSEWAMNPPDQTLPSR
jgi:hypothetical protein